jgi:hypothetical protein
MRVVNTKNPAMELPTFAPIYRDLLRASSLFSFSSGRVLMTSFFSSQPLRAMTFDGLHGFTSDG